MSSLFIQIDKPFYIAGDTVNGCVFLNLLQNISANQILIKFKGWESVKWYEEYFISEEEKRTIPPHLIYPNKYVMRMDSSDSEDHPGGDQCQKYKYAMDGHLLKQIVRYTGNRQIARFEQVLHNFGGNFIPAGQYSFPFSFKTGEIYPASFVDKSLKNNRRGRIKYEMQAFARGFNDRLFLLRTKQEIIIRQMSAIKNDQQQMQAHVKSCCCIDQGITRIQCFFQKNGYTPGQDARIYCKLDNTNGKGQVQSVDVTLVNEITYNSSDGNKITFSQNIFQKTFSGLGPGQKGQRQNVVKIMSTVAGTNPGNIKPTSRGNRLHSVYFLVVQASLEASCTCCSELPIVRQPILIYPFIPVNYIFKPPPNWSPKIMPAMNFQIGISSLGIKPQLNMNMELPSINANMNMGQSYVSFGMKPPNIGPSMNVNPLGSMNSGMPSMNIQINSNQNMQANGPSIKSHNQMGLGAGVNMRPY